jgi:GTP-binding protein HflX
MTEKRPRAVILGVQLPDVTDGEHASSLEELGRLAKTLGLDVVGRVTQRRTALAASAVLGEGKLRELAEWTGGTGVVPSGVPASRRKKQKDVAGEVSEEADPIVDEADGDADLGVSAPADGEKTRAEVVLVDHELTPSQARNLERATGAEVLDRTAVILSIFHRHAKSREARLQVEIARLGYMAPRMREAGAGGDRQRGGIGGKGAGESALELDRRKVRDRIAELRRELESIERNAGVRRKRRSEHPTVALVGYTNAGKSSLMRALTGSDVYVADKLFATLDTTVRTLVPETHPRILVSDTVGFIKKLPHDLVASFKSTLDEAANADLQLHLVDASDPAFRAQIEVTRAVLGEIEANDVPRVLLLNKVDRLDDETRQALALEHPDALLVSAHDPKDVARVHAFLERFFEKGMVEEELFVPYTAQRLVAELHASCRVLEEHHDEVGTRIRVVASPAVLGRIRASL